MSDAITAPTQAMRLTFDAPRAPTVGERVLMRYGGLIFSAAVHIVLASFLIQWPVNPPPLPPPPEPELIRISFAEPRVPPPPEIPQPEPTPPPPAPQFPEPDRAATSPEEPEEISDQPPTLAPQPAAPQEPSDLAGDERRDPARFDPVMPRFAETPDVTEVVQPELSPKELEWLQEQRTELKDQLAEISEREAEQFSEAQKLMMQSAARQTFYTSSGASDGVVREMELRGMPEPLINRVLMRNGIEIVYRYLDESFDSNKSGLNAVVTQNATYTARDRVQPGHYEVFEISEKAMRKLASLELDWLRRHGLKPEQVRLEKVTYGVVRTGSSGYWDLGILDIEYQRLEAQNPSPLK